ncbi:N-6 DNA methylase [Nocardia farcinica]|uniref:N-6 DNA methylase n=1 Tax=Nocardia farcinica TaxID=37329 RepID=UPI001893AF03|nr:N-6 DNA methylase [Nocardia farcinica]MBF6071626.1 N-6 DNA methylase [Nocardia farcinica]
MSKTVSTISAAELSRLAGVTRATVSNWRRRHTDFPKPVGGSEARPVFDLAQVRAWLAEHDIATSEAPLTELRTWLRSDAAPQAVARFMRSLRSADAGWAVEADDEVDTEFARRAVALLERVRQEDGARAAVDALADRALEEALASGVHRTPDPIAALMAELAVTAAGPRVRTALDPACGSGALLLAAAARGVVDLHGQDALPVQVERARLTVSAETGLEADIRLGDSLQADAFADLTADVVLTNPPYGQRDWGAAELAFDTRWQYGLPSRMESELAWVQHAVAHLRPGGVAAVLLPPAVAARPSGRKIRANLVRAGILRAVIALPPGAALPWHVGLQIWVLQRPLPDVRPADHVLFVDTTLMGAIGEGEQSTDWQLVTDQVTRAWRAFDEGGDPGAEADAAAAVGSIDVLDESVDLTPSRYVHLVVDTGALTGQLESTAHRLAAAGDELEAVRASLDGWLEGAARTWRHVTVAELAGHGWLQWIRAQSAAREDSGTGGESAVTGPGSGDDVGIEVGDVLLATARGDRQGGRAVRVAGPDDVAAARGPNLHTLRVDTDRLDPWFLAGFLLAGNSSAARATTMRFDPGRLRVPVLTLAEQQRYGALLRRLFRLRSAAAQAAAAVDDLADKVVAGLTTGGIAPAGDAEESAGEPFGDAGSSDER